MKIVCVVYAFVVGKSIFTDFVLIFFNTTMKQLRQEIHLRKNTLTQLFLELSITSHRLHH